MEYEKIKRRIEQAGLFTSLQRDRLVCGTRGGDWGIGGKSLWIAQKEGEWFISTWVPRIYVVAKSTDVVEAVIGILRSDDPHLYEVNSDLMERYELTEISYENYYGSEST